MNLHHILLTQFEFIVYSCVRLSTFLKLGIYASILRFFINWANYCLYHILLFTLRILFIVSLPFPHSVFPLYCTLDFAKYLFCISCLRCTYTLCYFSVYELHIHFYILHETHHLRSLSLSILVAYIMLSVFPS
jgi:hypothetical protein